jgi:hypothetical protein
MKNRIFEKVQVNQIISFEESGKIESAVVVLVNENTFTAMALRCWDKNGVKSFYEKRFSFYKTGTKTHHNHTNGNALSITGNV